MTRQVIASLQTGTDYAIEVRAVGADSYSEWSRRYIIETQINTNAPDTPQNVAFQVEGQGFAGYWDSVNTNVQGAFSKVERYEVELVANGVTVYDAIITHDAGRISYPLSFSDNQRFFTTAQPTVGFRVRAVDTANLKGVWSSQITVSNPVPAAPTSAVVNEGTNLIDLAWTASVSDDIDHYNVYIGITSNFTPSAGNRRNVGNALGFTYVTTTYVNTYFKIRAVDVYGQESTDLTAEGEPLSPFGSDTDAPNTPTGLTATLSETSGITRARVQWSQTLPVPDDLQGFQIRYRKTGDTEWFVETVGYDDREVTVVLPVPNANYDFQIRSYDFSGNFSAWTSTTVGTGVTNAVPATPEAPAVSSSTLRIQVTPTGLNSVGVAMDSDVTYYEVYASTTTGFVPAASNQVGVIPVGPAMATTFSVPASGGLGTQNWYVKVIAVDRGGLKSSASAQTTATPNLIESTNIVDATITSAKIASLAADKITAGTGLINALSVKTTLTIGDASTNGVIQSYDYVAGTTGYKLQKNALEINSGTIKAAALQLQVGQNLLPAQFADFEYSPSYYAALPIYGAGTGSIGSFSVTSSFAKFNSQCLSLSMTTLGSTIYTEVELSQGRSPTSMNIPVDPAKTYIVSYYAMTPSGSGNKTVRLVRSETGTGNYLPGTATVVADGTWQRFSDVYTPSAGATMASFRLRLLTLGTVYLDGVQVEEKVSSLTTPSTWTPPGMTRIDGSMIRTGEIRSSATALIWDTTANGGLGGYITDPNNNPMWSINSEGSAQFGELSVRGRVVVGLAGESETTPSTVASYNYAPGSSGWMLRSDGYAEIRNLAADSISGDVIHGGLITAATILGATVSSRQTDADGHLFGPGVDFQPLGLFSYDNNGLPNLSLPNDFNQPASFRGEAEITTLTTPNANFTATASILQGASMQLEGSVAAPTAAPTVTIGYDIQNLVPINDLDFASLHSWVSGYNNYWYTVDEKGGYVTRFNQTTGAYASRSTKLSTTHAITQGSVVFVPTIGTNGLTGNTLWVMFNENGVYKIRNLNTSMTMGAAFTPPMTNMAGSSRPVLGYDHVTGELLIAQVRSGDSVLVVNRYSATSTTALTLNSTYYGPAYSGSALSHISFGPFDFGQNVYIYKNISTYKTSWVVASTAGAEIPGFTWDVGMSADIVGLYWDGTNFKAASADGTIRKYEAGAGNRWTTTGTMNYYAAYSYTNAAAETMVSNVLTFILPKRARYTIKTNNLVTGTTGAKVYANRGTTMPDRTLASMWSQGAVNTATMTLLITNTALSGTQNKTANTGFGTGSAAMVRTTTLVGGDYLIRLSGDGSWRLGHLKGNADGTNADDTGWVTVTPATGFTATNVGVRYRRIGKNVQVDVNSIQNNNALTVSTTGTIADQVFAQIPATDAMGHNLRPTAPLRNGGQWVRGGQFLLDALGQCVFTSGDGNGTAYTITALSNGSTYWNYFVD